MHIQPLERRVLCYAGDILVTSTTLNQSNELRRVNQSGEVIGVTNIPGGYHDLAVNRAGEVQMWIDDKLWVHRGPISAGGAWQQEGEAAGWSSIGRTFYGGVAVLGPSVFVTDQETGGGGEARGLIRFDARDGYASPQRFATDKDLSDVTIGNDGLLYALNGGQTAFPQVHVYDPFTLAFLRTVDVPGFDNSSVVADSGGNIYVAGIFENTIWKLDPDGDVIDSVSIGATDLDIAADGTILLSGGGFVRLLDPDLNELESFEAGSFQGTTFVAFAEHQSPPALSGVVKGNVFNDLDADGLKDAGEAGHVGRTVWVDWDNDSVLDSHEPRVRTNAAGSYRIANVLEGTHTIRQVVPEGWTATKPSAKRVATVVAQQIRSGMNFGSWQNLSIRGGVFHDANKNGIREGAEPLLSGWQVFDDANDNGVLDPGEVSVRTNSQGRYHFTSLTAGTHVIRIVQQDGWRRTTQSTFLLTLGPGGVSTNKFFGEKRLA